MFSNEKINTGRQLEIDVARGLAVIFMIIIHIQLYFANSEVLDSYFADANDYLGDMPAAPMFMFLLGVGINYSRKNNWRVSIKRGVLLILAGYILNFIRGFLPNIINSYNLMSIDYLQEGILELMYVDILQFSGLAMIMFGVFRKYNFKNRTIVFVGIILSLLNIIMLNIQVDNIFISGFTGLFWGSNEYSYFPFLTWAFYPIAGFVFGSFLIRCKDKRKFYTIASIASAAIFFSAIYLFNVVLEIPTGLELETGYYHHIITDNIIFTAFVILEIAVLSFQVQLIPKFLITIAKRWSKNVTAIYCIHWVIITWMALIVPMNSLGMIGFLFAIITIVGLSDLISYLYGKSKRKELKI